MARRSRFGIAHVKKRGTFWGRSPADTAQTNVAAATAVLDSTFVGAGADLTIVRVRGQFIVNSDQAAATESPVGAVGACVVTDQAVAVGVGSIPTPYTDQDSDLWLVHQYFGFKVRFVSAVGVEPQWSHRYEFDSKAMRKVHQGQTMCWVVENGAATHGLEYYLQYAVLFKFMT